MITPPPSIGALEFAEDKSAVPNLLIAATLEFADWAYFSSAAREKRSQIRRTHFPISGAALHLTQQK